MLNRIFPDFLMSRIDPAYKKAPSSWDVYSHRSEKLASVSSSVHPIDLSNCPHLLAISRWQIHGQPHTNKIMYAIPCIAVDPGICLAHCQASFPSSSLHQTLPFQLIIGNTYLGPRQTLPRDVPVRSAQELVTTIKWRTPMSLLYVPYTPRLPCRHLTAILLFSK